MTNENHNLTRCSCCEESQSIYEVRSQRSGTRSIESQVCTVFTFSHYPLQSGRLTEATPRSQRVCSRGVKSRSVSVSSTPSIHAGYPPRCQKTTLELEFHLREDILTYDSRCVLILLARDRRPFSWVQLVCGTVSERVLIAPISNAWLTFFGTHKPKLLVFGEHYPTAISTPCNSAQN